MGKHIIYFSGSRAETVKENYTVKIGDNIVIPKNLIQREFLIAASSTEECLIVFLNGRLPFAEELSQKLSPYFFAQILIGKSNLVIPSDIRKNTPFEEIGHKIQIVGRDDYIEIWPAENYTKETLGQERKPLLERITGITLAEHQPL